MPELRIDAEDLMTALEHHDPYGSYWFLDLQTGETALYSDGELLGVDEDEEDADDGDGPDPDRYRRIDPLASRVGFQVMEDFAETVADERAREALLRALGGRHPFRSFKDALLDYPALREAWFRFHDEAYLQLAREWLADEGIEAELVVPKRAAQDG